MAAAPTAASAGHWCNCSAGNGSAAAAEVRRKGIYRYQQPLLLLAVGAAAVAAAAVRPIPTLSLSRCPQQLFELTERNDTIAGSGRGADATATASSSASARRTPSSLSSVGRERPIMRRGGTVVSSITNRRSGTAATGANTNSGSCCFRVTPLPLTPSPSADPPPVRGGGG